MREAMSSLGRACWDHRPSQARRVHEEIGATRQARTNAKSRMAGTGGTGLEDQIEIYASYFYLSILTRPNSGRSDMIGADGPVGQVEISFNILKIIHL